VRRSSGEGREREEDVRGFFVKEEQIIVGEY
jgi:hypothetical protein